MPATLDQIVAATRRRVAETRLKEDFRALELRAQSHLPRGFRRRLEQKACDGIAVIAELKKASPSRGLIRPDFDPIQLAKELENSAATALSVLTDEEFFQGSLENLRKASASVSLPCLRKDFIIDDFQLLEARANGADAVLLIVAALPQPDLKSLVEHAAEHELDVLCEVHNENELERALEAGCDLIGVNNRDLRTFQVDLETAYRLAALMPQNVLSVAESGIHSGTDLSQLRAAGYKAFLMGESLMRSPSPGKALQQFLAEASVAVPTR
jgi:indole-3-glycerol phosphate synthase